MAVTEHEGFEKILEDFADTEMAPAYGFVHDTLYVADRIVRSVANTEKPDFHYVLAVYDRIVARSELLEEERDYVSFRDDDDNGFDDEFDEEKVSE